MIYLVHVHGRRNPMSFDRLSSADSYRRVMLPAGKFARTTGGDALLPAGDGSAPWARPSARST